MTDQDLDRAVFLCNQERTTSQEELWLAKIIPEIVAELRRVREDGQVWQEALEKIESLCNDGKRVPGCSIAAGAATAVENLKAENEALRKEHEAGTFTAMLSSQYQLWRNAHRAAQAMLDGEETK